MAKEKYVYVFGNKKADGDGSMKPLLGGKGANLAAELFLLLGGKEGLQADGRLEFEFHAQAPSQFSVVSYQFSDNRQLITDN